MKQRRLARVIAWAAITLAAVACGRDAATPSPMALSASLSFHTMWWSEAQMANFNPNAPPPKATDIAITKWEYTDPVGVPHPDSVEFVVDLKNDGEGAAESLVAEVSAEWRVGKQAASDSGASWRGPQVVRTITPGPIAPGASITLRVPLDIVTKMTELEKSEEWPFALRATLNVHATGSTTSLLSRQLLLPIRPGD